MDRIKELYKLSLRNRCIEKDKDDFEKRASILKSAVWPVDQEPVYVVPAQKNTLTDHELRGEIVAKKQRSVSTRVKNLANMNFSENYEVLQVADTATMYLSDVTIAYLNRIQNVFRELVDVENQVHYSEVMERGVKNTAGEQHNEWKSQACYPQAILRGILHNYEKDKISRKQYNKTDNELLESMKASVFLDPRYVVKGKNMEILLNYTKLKNFVTSLSAACPPKMLQCQESLELEHFVRQRMTDNTKRKRLEMRRRAEERIQRRCEATLTSESSDDLED